MAVLVGSVNILVVDEEVGLMVIDEGNEISKHKHGEIENSKNVEKNNFYSHWVLANH